MTDEAITPAQRLPISETERGYEEEADDWYANNRISKEEDDRLADEEAKKSDVEVLTEALQLLSQAHLRLVERVRKLEGENV